MQHVHLGTTIMRSILLRSMLAGATALCCASAAFAAEPPALLNYQGVLRDAYDAPLEGAYHMIFRFYSAETGGDQILIDEHPDGSGIEVVVSGGLFNVALGSGDISDGSGPGTYASLAEVFRDYAEVWLEVEVHPEVLSPRIRIVSAAYSLNADHLDGNSASYFLDTSDTEQTKTGTLRIEVPNDLITLGLVARSSSASGVFWNYDGSQTLVGHPNYGFTSYGIDGAGYFEDIGPGHSGEAYLAWIDQGISASGTEAGGYFEDSDSSGNAYIGYGDFGLEAVGNEAGGYFEDSDGSSTVWVGRNDNGISSYGDQMGGYFQDNTSGTYVRVAYENVAIDSNGSKASVQNHPYEDDKVIMYSSLGGDEVGTYTRGTARLEGGVVRVDLGETFKWVTNPDIGLTVHLTPQGECRGLYVESKSTSEIVVRELNGGTGDVPFDYIVHGLRIGFEESAPVRKESREAFLPRMDEQRKLFEENPELHRLTAMERFKKMRAAVLGDDSADIDWAESEALRAAIQEYDPEIHGTGGDRTTTPVESTTTQPYPEQDSIEEGSVRSSDRTQGPTHPSFPPTADVLENRYNSNTLFLVDEPVEPGDLLALDPSNPGQLRRAATIANPAVIGIADGASIELDGSLQAPVIGTGFTVIKADASYGVIMAGDLLVSSPTPGHAMAAVAPVQGTVVGKALEPLDLGTGLIKVLVNIR